MFEFIRSALSVVGIGVLIVLIVIFWTALAQRRRSADKHDDDPSQPHSDATPPDLPA